MLIESLLFEMEYKKESLKYINNYLIDEISDAWCNHKGMEGETFSKIMGLLHANLSVVESIEKILTSYQKGIDENYTKLLKKEI